MGQLNSRHWQCDNPKCKRKILRCDTVFINTIPQIALCRDCACTLVNSYTKYKNQQREHKTANPTYQGLTKINSEGVEVWNKSWTERIGMFVIEHDKGSPAYPKMANYLLR